MGRRHAILELLERDSTLTPEQIAAMLNLSLKEVTEIIEGLEESHTIAGYHAVVDWEKTEKQSVSAFIELRVSPQRGFGFDRIAERISRYPEVKSVYLMSGGFDLSVIVEKDSLAECAKFVWEKLASMDTVVSTTTHFVMKKYKEDGIAFMQEPEDDRDKDQI